MADSAGIRSGPADSGRSQELISSRSRQAVDRPRLLLSAQLFAGLIWLNPDDTSLPPVLGMGHPFEDSNGDGKGCLGVRHCPLPRHGIYSGRTNPVYDISFNGGVQNGEVSRSGCIYE